MYFKSGLHGWQLAGKTNVYRTAPTAALHILFASPTSARQDFNPQPKLVLIYRPHEDERLSWPEQMKVHNLLKVVTKNDFPQLRVEPGSLDPESDTLSTEPLMPTLTDTRTAE